MNWKCLVGLLVVLLWTGWGRAQSVFDGLPGLPMPQEEETVVAEAELPHTASDWITFASRNFQFSPDMQPHTLFPIGTEPFLRVGPSTPFGAGTYAHTLDTGWMIEGGVRALIWNAPHDAAWVVEASISNTWNSANSSSARYPTTLNIIQNGVFGNQVVTVRDLNQTFVNLGGGRDWYLWCSPATGRSLRLGLDAGGRWGTGKADFNEIPHRTGILYGGYAAMHVDLLIPCGGCFAFVCGLRCEYDLMENSNFLQSTTVLQNASLLFNVGLRF